jgi:diaminopropionate ammonia-lyase
MLLWKVHTYKLGTVVVSWQHLDGFNSFLFLVACPAAMLPNATEDNIAAAASYAGRADGGDWTSYPQFVAYGSNGQRGHYAGSSTGVRILPGKSLFLELGGCYQRYHCAMMRTVYIGAYLPPALGLAEKSVASAIAAMRAALVPGVTPQEVYHAAHDAMSPLLKHGWIISQRLGYSIGISFYTDWGEASEINICPRSKDRRIPLHATLHLIPWVRHPVYGGVGFSDTVVVTAEGAVSLLGANKPAEKMVLIQPTTPHLDQALTVREFFKDTLKEPTPLIKLNPGGPLELGCTVLVKDESSRLGQKSFKAIGGAYTAAQLLAQISSNSNPAYSQAPEKVTFSDFVRKEDEQVHVFCTASDGNHGHGLAWAANFLGHKAIIYYPASVAKSRIEHAESLGAEVRVSTLGYDDTVALAARTAAQEGWHLIQDTAWEGYTAVPRNIMAGYKLIAHEVLEQIDAMASSLKLTHAVLQVGVGSFAAAITDYLKESKLSGVSIITLEPRGSACLYKSLQAGVKTDLPPDGPETISVGLDCGVVSDLAWPTLRVDVHAAVTFTDNVAADGVRAAHAVGIKAGESGAATGLGFLRSVWGNEAQKRALGLNNKSNVLVFNTEGLTDPELHAKLVAESLAPRALLPGGEHSLEIHVCPLDRSLHLGGALEAEAGEEKTETASFCERTSSSFALSAMKPVCSLVVESSSESDPENRFSASEDHSEHCPPGPGSPSVSGVYPDGLAQDNFYPDIWSAEASPLVTSIQVATPATSDIGGKELETLKDMEKFQLGPSAARTDIEQAGTIAARLNPVEY